MTEIGDLSVADYQSRARDWLAQHAPHYSGAIRDSLSLEQDLALARQWQALKAEHGYAAITMPKVYGGAGGSELEKIIFTSEEMKYRLPTEYFVISLHMPIPMLLRYGSESIKQQLIPPAIRGEHIWCQLFSEPSAGSDLAAIRLRAERHGEGWLLNGQKLWTSWAQYSDWGVIVTRTDPNVVKHAGLTYFYINMQAAGIEVRNVRKLVGHSEVNEVFFNDVYVPDSYRMGDIGAGFKLAIETLMIERYAASDEGMGGIPIKDFVELLGNVSRNGRPALEDGEVRRFLADSIFERQGLRSIHRRALQAIADGQEPGPEGSIRKLLLARRRQAMGELAMDLLGADGVRLPENAGPATNFAWSWLDAPGPRIAGGSDEILRNTIAEKILGLPQDHRPDKGMPFNKI